MTAVTTAAARKVRVPPPEPYRPTARFVNVKPARALMLPAAFSIALVAFGLLPSVRQNPRLLWSLWGTGIVLLGWTGAILVDRVRRGRTLTLEIVLRKQHYLQACAQGSVLLYWGWYWREVYHSAHLIAAQLVFAYAFDMLLAWARRDTYTLGFGPFPVIFSINLFLWFKPDWFYLQFVMVAAGFAAKELIRWTKDGRRVHIFNPSSFPLGLFSLVLILTGTTHLTFGQEIATTLFYPPYIYVMIFLIGLPGQFFFGVTSMTMSAVVTMYAFGLLYFAATGTYFFFDEYIPIAVFLGMHLLFTDPSTAPRSELGRVMFGMLYALSVVALYALLGAVGAPTFYDKLLAVPILNLTIQAIDRMARSNPLRRFDLAAVGRALTGSRRNLAYIGIWATVFVVMTAAEGVGDTHRGHWVPFWQQACQEGRRNACRNLGVMQATYCERGSGWACNEVGVLAVERLGPIPAAKQLFERACGLGFTPACANTQLVARGQPAQRANPMLADYPIVLLEGKGPLPDLTPVQLYERACSQGWTDGCQNACDLGSPVGCGAIGK